MGQRRDGGQPPHQGNAPRSHGLRIVMLTSSYPLYPGDTTAPFIEELAAHVAALGHEVHVALPADPRLRRSSCERGVRLHPFRYAPNVRALQVWGYAGALAGDVGLKPAALVVAPLALAASTLACRRLARRLRPDLAERALGLGAAEPATAVIPYGVDPALFRPGEPASRAAVRRELGLGDG